MAEWLFFADEFDMLEFGMDLHEPDLDEDIYEF
jgi:hypothetical protein